MPLPFVVCQPPASPLPVRASPGRTGPDRDPRTAPFVQALMAAATCRLRGINPSTGAQTWRSTLDDFADRLLHRHEI